MNKSRLLGAVCVVTLALLLITNTANALQYSIVDLGTLGGTGSSALGINDAGQVVGQAGWITGSTGIHAFLWDKGVMTDLDALNSGASAAYDINNTGQITGWSYVGASVDTSTFLYENGVKIDLGAPNGFNASMGYGINESGQIVGQAIDAGNSNAFLYSNSLMMDLGTVSPGNPFTANSINNAGQIVGWGQHAFVYENDTWTDLGTLSGSQSAAYDINNAGQIVGMARVADSFATPHAVLWQNNSIVDLGTLYGNNTVAHAINDAGQVVGIGTLVQQNASEEDGRAFLWDDGMMTDLSLIPEVQAAGWTSLNHALDINEAGQIVGWGIIDNEKRAFLLTTIPIPPALYLFGSGLLGLVGLARRRPKK